MTKTTRYAFVAFVVFAMASMLVSEANAQCCGQSPVAYAQPTTAYYQPTTAYYQPVAYQAYRPADAWYPGKWLGQLNRRIWGVPETYAVAAPTTYAAAYTPSYTAAYAPSYSVGYATTSYSAPAVSYGAPACTTCAMPVTTVSEVSLRPVTSACDSCCGGATVSQAAYTSSPGCANCAVAPTNYESSAPSSYQAPAASSTSTPPSTYSTPERAPEIDPNADVAPQRQEAQMPSTGDTNNTNESSRLDPVPEAESGNNTTAPSGTTPANGTQNSSTYFEAPQLFDPSDRAAQKNAAPVRTAVLHRPAMQMPLTTSQISWQQAEADAAGWVSAGE